MRPQGTPCQNKNNYNCTCGKAGLGLCCTEEWWGVAMWFDLKYYKLQYVLKLCSNYSVPFANYALTIMLLEYMYTV